MLFRSSSDRMKIIRVCGPNDFFVERVIFPYETIVFSCPLNSDVEIWLQGVNGPEALETYSSNDLETNQALGRQDSILSSPVPSIDPPGVTPRNHLRSVRKKPFNHK